MANCRACGAPINPQERFCGYCGADQMAAPPQAGYAPAPVRAGGGGLARAAMGLGIAGGLLGVVWGALGPWLTYKWSNTFLWGEFGTPGLKYVEVPLILGLVLGILGIVGGAVAPKNRGVAAVILLVCGIVGFLVGPSWVPAGTLLLAAAGLAIADKG
jgi:hypothetical protein